MRSLVRWAIRNPKGMNALMLVVVLLGAFAIVRLRRETFPAFELDVIQVRVPYPGASPEEVEEGICQKIEEVLRPIEGIDKTTSVASEGMATVVLELDSGVADPQRVLSEVRSEIDRLSTLPELAEDPVVQQLTMRQPAIFVGIVAPEGTTGLEAERELREVAEGVRDEILELDAVSLVELVGARDYEIDVEIPEDALRRHGLSLSDVARTIRRENLDLPGGTMRTPGQEVLLRGKDRRTLGREIERIPLVTLADGTALDVADLGTVRDGFTDAPTICRIDARPALALSIERTSEEDLLVLVEEVRSYVEKKELPAGYELVTWGDRSVDVRDRFELLSRNGLQGLVVVFLLLALFLDLRLAFWVAIGIPISIAGACAVLWFAGQTLNMISMFGFLVVLGIVVDDAIVIGENVHSQRRAGKSPMRAAVDGTLEVLPAVASSVLTTIIAFLPLFFVAGVMGKFIAVMPLAVVATLSISLFEAAVVFPGHVAHEKGPVLRFLEILLVPLLPAILLLQALQKLASRLLDLFVRRVYAPLLRLAVDYPALAPAGAVALLLVSAGFLRSGAVSFVLFPKMDSRAIEARISFPDGTPASVTDEATTRMEEAIREVGARHAARGERIVVLTERLVGQGRSGAGSHVGSVSVEIVDPSRRQAASHEILAEWRAAAGEFPGAESVVFDSPSMHPAGKPIEFEVLAGKEDQAELEEAVARCQERLAAIPGVFDVSDDFQPGKWEYRIRMKESARGFGVSTAELAQTVRATYHGEEVMRLQRGRHEVKLMVRYPLADRRSLARFEDIRVRTPDGLERPITELAEIEVARGPSALRRIDQRRAITVSADIDESKANARQIVRELQSDFVPDLLERHPGISFRWGGQQEQTKESLESLAIGFAVAAFAMFVLLAIEFRSYLQPLLILAIIPFGGIGAVAGHLVLGIPVTIFSMFGMVALSGVVIDNSIVLVDSIDQRLREGCPLREALLESGVRRFRPVFLTSVTTIGGLVSLLWETSFQAQVIIPMAASLIFGLAFTTVLVLLLVPAIYRFYAMVAGVPTAEEPETQADPAPLEAVR